MAGVRHHILPRFLLKGFASKQDKDSVFVWVHRKNAPPFEANTINISVEKHFYGREGEINADDEITRIEGGYSDLINELRGAKKSVDYCSPEIAEFIAHLSIRTKNVRSGLFNAIEGYTNRFVEILTIPSNLEKLVKLIKPGLLDSLLKRFPESPPETLEEIAGKLIQETLERMRNNKDEIEKIITDAKIDNKNLLSSQVPNELKNKHNQLLKDDVLPSEKIESYKNLNWFVVSTNQTLILGDAGCLVETGGERRFKAFEYTDDYIVNIFLPISSNKIVVGTRYANVQPLNIKTINRAFASSSYEYFICSENSPEKVSLSSKIGEWFGTVSNAEIEWMIQNLFKEVFKDID